MENNNDQKNKRAFQAMLLELFRYRTSLVHLHQIVRRDRQKIKELEKIVSAFVEPS